MLSVFKSNIFKGFLFVVFMVCDGMSGVLQNGVERSISDRQKFLNMTEDDLKGVTNITFKNQSVDDEFCDHWYDLELYKERDTLSFRNCQFSDSSLCIFANLPVKNLTLNSCGISAEDTSGIFLVSPYVIKSIDLSNNNLGADSELFCKNLKQYILNISNPRLTLQGNNFTEDDQLRMKKLNKDYCCSVTFNF